MTNELDLLKNEVAGHEYRTVGFNKDCTYAGHLPSLLGSVNCWRAEANRWLKENEIKVEELTPENLDRIAIRSGTSRETLGMWLDEGKRYHYVVYLRHAPKFMQKMVVAKEMDGSAYVESILNDPREWEGI